MRLRTSGYGQGKGNIEVNGTRHNYNGNNGPLLGYVSVWGQFFWMLSKHF